MTWAIGSILALVVALELARKIRDWRRGLP